MSDTGSVMPFFLSEVDNNADFCHRILFISIYGSSCNLFLFLCYTVSMRKVIVDIDNTLWDFASVLWERMRKINPEVPAPEEWTLFDFWRQYCSPREFYAIIKGIHCEQDRFNPYPDAKEFLASLSRLGFYIIIASHREKGTLEPTIKWLEKNDLIFHEVHLSHDKTVLFNDCWAVVDDSPFILDKALEFQVLGTGLRVPWNKNGKYMLFDSLAEIYNFLNDKERAISTLTS